MSVEERAADIKTRLRNDMAKTLRSEVFADASLPGFSQLLDALMEDALHQIEPLLVEIDDAEKAVAAHSGVAHD